MDDDIELARRALEAGFLTPDTVQQALAACADGTRLTDVLLARGWLTPALLAQFSGPAADTIVDPQGATVVESGAAGAGITRTRGWSRRSCPSSSTTERRRGPSRSA